MRFTRILLLGHSGFIGKHVLAYFKTTYPEVEIIGDSLPSMDLTSKDSVDKLAPLCTSNTLLINCAAIKRQLGDSLELYEQNMAMIATLAQTLLKNPVGCMINMSSCAVYGEENENTAITEDTSLNPTSWYGAAKVSAELVLNRTGNRIIHLRPPLIYGPGDIPCYGPSGFTQTAKNSDTITLWGDGSEKREFIYVGDVPPLMDTLANSSCSGPVNVISGVSYNYQDVLTELKSAGLALNTTSKPRSKPQVDHGFVPTIIKEQFPNFSFTTLSEGMKHLR